jgi:hypothetical protein
LPAALYGVLVWPFVWGSPEQVTYDGHLVSRFRVLCGSTSVAVAVVAFAWSFQHVVMPLTFDSKFMVFLLLSSVPHSVFATAHERRGGDRHVVDLDDGSGALIRGRTAGGSERPGCRLTGARRLCPRWCGPSTREQEPLLFAI